MAMEPSLPTEFKTACGGVTLEPEKYPSALYQGERVYFCTQACLKAFEDNPDSFMRGEVEHLED